MFAGDIEVHAHKCILAARCEVMAAMFSGNFTETGDKAEVIVTCNKSCQTDSLDHSYY